MGDTKLTFKRYEKKYLLSPEKYAALREKLDEYIVPDLYFESTVCSIYYDTDSYDLIRNSIEKPVYKEKLRLRSYNIPSPEEPVFIELKKKFKGVVYKRRTQMTAAEATAYLSGEAPPPEDNQVIREINWFLQFYKPQAKVFIACDRAAWVAKDNPELRFTFDSDLRWREDELVISSSDRGEPLLEKGWVLMEIKIPGAAPMWLARMLSDLEIYPVSFSKYGTCYKNHIIFKKYITE